MKIRGEYTLMIENGLEIKIGNTHKNHKGINIMRPTQLGNPFKIGIDGDRSTVVSKYRQYLYRKIREKDKKILPLLQSMYIKLKEEKQLELVCCCAPKICHGEVIAEVLLSQSKLEEGE